MAISMQKAFQSRNADIIKKWLESAPDVDVRDDHEFTALMFAAKYGYGQVADVLLSRKAAIDAQNIAGDTALHIATQEGNLEIVKLLLGTNANVNSVNDHGNSPMHYACFRRFADIAKLLLTRGASVSLENNFRKTPIHFAGTTLGPELSEKANSNGGMNLLTKAKSRSVDLVEAEAKSKHIAMARKKFWETNSTAIILGDLLWKSDRCDVFEGKCSGLNVLVKKLSLKQGLSPGALELLKDSLLPLQKVAFTYLASVIGTCAEKDFSAILFELKTTTTLQQLLHDGDIFFEPLDILRHARDICSALIYLHQNHLAHLNLKSRNIMINQTSENDTKIFVVDYGLHNTVLGQLMDDNDRIYEPEWVAPELLRTGKFPDPQAGDVYAFGILLFEMATRLYPYDGLSGMHIGLKVAIEGARPKIPEYMPEHLKSLVELCWDDNYRNRPRLSEIQKVLEEMMAIL